MQEAGSPARLDATAAPAARIGKTGRTARAEGEMFA
jgi:hypothetical protein